MARMRSLRPDYFLREDMADVSLEAHFLLAGLQILADRDGRLKDQPRTIKAQVFPFRDVDVDGALAELVRVRAVARYEVEGRRVIALLTWEDDQTPHPKETSADLPPPPVHQHGSVTHEIHASGKVADASRRDPLGLGVGIGSRDGCGSTSSAAADAPTGSQAALLDVPTEGASEPPPKPKPRKQADGEHHALWRALEAEYLRVMGHPYASGNGGADATAVKWLRETAKVSPEEAVRRWGNLLAWSKSSPNGFPTVTGFKSLQQHWIAPQVVSKTQSASNFGTAKPENKPNTPNILELEARWKAARQ